MQYVLSFETSGEVGGCAIVDHCGKVIHEVILDEKRRHGELLLPAAQECLSKCKLADSSLGVAVDIGPGSYTGLRVGVMAAKSFAFGRKLPIVGISSLDALAFTAPSSYSEVVVANVSRKNEIYYCKFTRNGDSRLIRDTEIMAISYDETIEEISSLSQKTLLLGNACRVLKLGDLSRPQIEVIEKISPTPASVASIGWQRFKNGNCEDNLHDIQPIYPRRAGITMPVLGEPVIDREK